MAPEVRVASDVARPFRGGAHSRCDRLNIMRFTAPLIILTCLCLSGCTLVPEWTYKPEFHNPFPQLSRVAVLPFYNQSTYPTLNGAHVANLYRAELQKIRGFDVMPIGVVDRFLHENRISVGPTTNLQQLAQILNVDAVVVGSITDYDPYYPPKMGLAVNWYAANSSFHPIPPGYGLPWGTTEEEYIPDTLVHEAEFWLAKQQMKTQTPHQEPVDGDPFQQVPAQSPPKPEEIKPANHEGPVATDGTLPPQLPPDWPDPRGFIPPAPMPEPPPYNPHTGPIIELVRQYDGADEDFTTSLESYYYFRDDARFGGWQSYLDRTDDFIQFCCYRHITEMLAARGGASESRLVFRWPIDRYDR